MSADPQASAAQGIPVPAFRALMRRHHTLLVHCAGVPKGAGNGTTAAYGAIECLQVALAGAGSPLALAASTLREGDDEFSLFGRANCTGPLGLILSPRSAQSIKGASPRDLGSVLRSDNTRYVRTDYQDPDAAALEAAITGRVDNEYNEVVISDYEVLGVIVIARWKGVIDYVESELTLPDVAKGLPRQPLFLWHPTLKIACQVDEQWNPMESRPRQSSDFYPASGAAAPKAPTSP